ncbi:MAG TPA: DUF4198 domain-containing protein [Methylomirabilota bacterium]|nr:DUF4198 domain-containing protein [Methylomirabilota bacterium]
MKRFSKLLLISFCALIFFRPQTAWSHDGWVEISPTIVEKGQVATIALIQGNHSNEHRSYRIAGKWDQKYTTLVVVDPNGKKNALTDRLIDFGEDNEKIAPKGPKGYYLASFTPNEEGLYQAVARQVRTIQQGDGPKALTMRIAKTTFASLNVPGISMAKNLKGFDLMSGGGDGLEIFPVTNPVGIFSGGSVTLELRLKGNPIAGKVISLIPRVDGSGSVQDRTTDEKGRVTFAVGPSDFYLARANLEEEKPRPDGRADKNSYEATYVFQAFNRP